MLEQIVSWIIHIVHELGYLGLFVMTFLESTFTPLPSEVTLIPAGFLIHEGKMHFLPVILSCWSGTMAGSYFTYWLAQTVGKRVLVKYGKYFFFPESKILWVESYFLRHGRISVFTGRLVPGVRHIISFPAGLANMPLKFFMLCTFLGSSVWMGFLLAMGYFMGKNQELIMQYIMPIKLGILLFVPVFIGFYIWRNRSKKAKALKLRAELEKQ